MFLRAIGPHLQGVNISRQFLESANLSFLNLENANIQNSFLFAANLTNSNLKNANLAGTRLEGIYWNEDTNWDGVIGLDKAIGVSDSLKCHLNMDL